MNDWCVYKHTFPDGRTYIGITSDDPENRWNDGFGYRHHGKLFYEIVCHGWYNIKHEILISGLDEKTAKSEERRLIRETPYEMTLNTIHAIPPAVVKAEKEDVIHKEFESGDPMSLGAYFQVHYNGDWRDKYKRDGDLPPFSIKIYSDYAVLMYFRIKDDIFSTYEYRIDVPADVITYSDLRQFLLENKGGTWITEKDDPLPSDWKERFAIA